jgi:hypothetical protein
MSDQLHFINVTITPVIRVGERKETLYRITHDGSSASMWVEHGTHKTLEAVLAAFSPPLRASYQAAVLSALANGEVITFSLQHAYDSL